MLGGTLFGLTHWKMSTSTMVRLTAKNKSDWSMKKHSMRYFILTYTLLSYTNVNAFSTHTSIQWKKPIIHLKQDASSIQNVVSVSKPVLLMHPLHNRHKGTVSQLSSTSKPISSKNNEWKGNKKALVSTLSLIYMDIVLRKAFKKASISFPSSLAGCGILFTTLLFLDVIKPDSKLYNALSPGADVLAKWLPVFFVPSLVTLPLAPSLGSAMEVCHF